MDIGPTFHIRPTKGAAKMSGLFCVYGNNFAREYYNTVLECLVAINTAVRPWSETDKWTVEYHVDP